VAAHAGFRVYGDRVSLWRLALVVLVLAACSKTSSESSAAAEAGPDPSHGFAAPEGVVKAFFVAAEAADCAALGKILILPDAGVLDAERCEAITHELTESKAHLVRIVETKVDGRDKNAVLVTTEVEDTKNKSGNLHPWVIRAEWHDGSWKVRF
jgi:hypothetical protein